jgi:uncharacterized protein YciI
MIQTARSFIRVMCGAALFAQAGGMKVVNYVAYTAVPGRVAALRPAHREYMTQLHADGRLVACGPFTDGSGALYIYETGSLAAADEILAADPYHIGGVFADCKLSAWEIIKANPVLIPATR